MASVNISITRDNGTNISAAGTVDDAVVAGMAETLAEALRAQASEPATEVTA